MTTRPIILVAPNGARLSKADHPALPITTSEIVETANKCFTEGADGLHLHVRNEDGTHSLDTGRYRETIAELTIAVPTMRIQITTESAGIFDVPAQLRCLKEVQPEWASISISEIARQPELADHVYGTCASQGTEVQHILYNTDDIALLHQWQLKKLVRANQTSVLFVLNRYSEGQLSSPSDLDTFLKAMPKRNQWMVCAFGPHEHDYLIETARHGGDLRVGFENSLVGADNNAWADNASSLIALSKRLQGEAL